MMGGQKELLVHELQSPQPQATVDFQACSVGTTDYRGSGKQFEMDWMAIRLRIG